MTTTDEHPAAALHDLLLPNLASGVCIVHADLAGLGSTAADGPSMAQVVDSLADAIFVHTAWGDRPVVLVPYGAVPPAEELGRLCGHLSDELDVPVVSCAGDVQLSEGRLHGSESFLQWSPTESDQLRAAALDLGHYYPPMPDEPQPVGHDLVDSQPVDSQPVGSQPVDPQPVDEDPVEAPRVDLRPVILELGRLPVLTGAVLSSRAAPVAAPPHQLLTPVAHSPADPAAAPAEAPAQAPILAAPIITPPVDPAAAPAVDPPTRSASESASTDNPAVARPTSQPVPLTTPWTTLPSVDAAPAPPADTHDRAAAPADGNGPQTGQANDGFQVDQPGGALSRRTESALWTPLRSDIQPASRDELKELLGWRYEACLRSVTSALALHPTLRKAAAAEHDLPALIALNAYLTGSTEEVDAALRGELAGDDSRRDLLRALASGAVAGLARFPISRSPIFVAGTTTSEILSGLVPGELLVEPAFVLASSRPSADESAGESAGTKIQYALWPQAARRIAQLMPNADGNAPLVVAAGSSWRVLGFADDEDGTAGWDPAAPVSPNMPTVFLAQAGGRAAADDETLLERLARALRQAPGTDPGPPRGALGHDRNGTRFRLERLDDETEIRSAQ